jgi:hypothetical protein
MFLVSDEQLKDRLDICRKCEFVRILPAVGEQCTVCNCLMALKAKMKFTSCPKEKWQAIDL